MHWDEFSDWGAKISQWAADYHRNLRNRPVRAQTEPGDVAALIAQSAPEGPQSMEEIMADFERVVMPDFLPIFRPMLPPHRCWRRCWFQPLRHNVCSGRHHRQRRRWKL